MAALIVTSIDPGPARSAWLHLVDGMPARFAIESNEELLARIRASSTRGWPGPVVIEKVESFGMSVGAEVFETVYWTGRFAEAIEAAGGTVSRLGRLKVKSHLCHSGKAKDANIRQALIDRFGGPTAIGRKGSEGPLYGVSKDVWSALAIAVTFADQLAAAA